VGVWQALVGSQSKVVLVLGLQLKCDSLCTFLARATDSGIIMEDLDDKDNSRPENKSRDII